MKWIINLCACETKFVYKHFVLCSKNLFKNQNIYKVVACLELTAAADIGLYVNANNSSCGFKQKGTISTLSGKLLK